MRAGYCAAIEHPPDLRRSQDVARIQRRKAPASNCSRRSASFLRPHARSPVSGSAGALGRPGAPLADHDARHHRRWLVTWRFVEELFTVYEAFLHWRISPLAALPFQFADFAYWQRHWRSHPELTHSSHTGVSSFTIRCRDEARCWPCDTDYRRFPHGTTGFHFTGEPIGSGQTLQRSRRRYPVYGTGRGLEDGVAALL